MTCKNSFRLLLAVGVVGMTAQATVLYTFSGGADGGNPQGPLAADASGNLYGSAQTGGLGYGVIFKLAPPAAQGEAWTESVLYSFTNGADGAAPAGGLVLDGKGNLYGVTDGGASVVFRLSPSTGTSGSWTFSVLYTFAQSVLPNPLLLDARGNLYGTTQYGGDSQFLYGQAYELSPPAAAGDAWTFTSLHSFQGPPTDGAYPASSLSMDTAGNLFGTASQGGKGTCFDAGTVIGCGTVFEISPSGSGWAETSIYNFTVHENNAPYWGLAMGRGHTMYGTATYAAFKITSTNGVEWEKATIYQFTEGISGTIPTGTLITDAKGRLYGTSYSSGLSGYSTAFQLSPPTATGTAWTETTLANFAEGFNAGQPNGGVVFGKAGELYGVTAGGGAGAFGAVFAVAP
jgi:hypothetical protein